MQINKELLKSKQRILIGGDEGAPEIFALVKHVLNHIKKQAAFYTIGEEFTPSDAPIVIMRGGDELENNEAIYQKLDIHILLVHLVTENIPHYYGSYEQYIAELEKLADSLPKAGTLIYFEDDNVATMMGKKEREDVKSIEYSSLPATKTGAGLDLKIDSHTLSIKTEDKNFPAHAGAAQALLNRIGVSNEQIVAGLKTL